MIGFWPSVLRVLPARFRWVRQTVRPEIWAAVFTATLGASSAGAMIQVPASSSQARQPIACAPDAPPPNYRVGDVCLYAYSYMHNVDIRAEEKDSAAVFEESIKDLINNNLVDLTQKHIEVTFEHGGARIRIPTSKNGQTATAEAEESIQSLLGHWTK